MIFRPSDRPPILFAKPPPLLGLEVKVSELLHPPNNYPRRRFVILLLFNIELTYLQMSLLLCWIICYRIPSLSSGIYVSISVVNIKHKQLSYHKITIQDNLLRYNLLITHHEIALPPNIYHYHLAEWSS